MYSIAYTISRTPWHNRKRLYPSHEEEMGGDTNTFCEAQAGKAASEREMDKEGSRSGPSREGRGQLFGASWFVDSSATVSMEVDLGEDLCIHRGSLFIGGGGGDVLDVRVFADEGFVGESFEHVLGNTVIGRLAAIKVVRVDWIV